MDLSRRLQRLIDLVPDGMTVADVGCDHGFVSIRLVSSGKCPGAIAMDVKEGPLSRAREHIKDAGLEDKIETRQADGLSGLVPGEAQAVVIAGMGGPLMQRILSDHMEVAKAFSCLILQPQSEVAEFRTFLRQNGFRIVRNEILKEDGKYYFPMVVEPDETYLYTRSELGDMYGSDLLVEDRGLSEYLVYEKEKLDQLMQELQELENVPYERIGVLQKHITYNETAQAMLSLMNISPGDLTNQSHHISPEILEALLEDELSLEE